MYKKNLLAVVGAVVLAVLGACGNSGSNGGAPLDIPVGCNPLAHTSDCLLPFPSDFFLEQDTSLPSGRRVRLPERAAVYTPEGRLADPSSVYPFDGFSHTGPILALLKEEFDEGSLVSHQDDPSASLSPQSPTLLIEADSASAVAHFAETDAWADDHSRRALLIRPLVRLADATRYIVAIHGLTDRQGQPLVAPPGFSRLRDGLAGGDPVLEPLAAHFENDIFPVLEQLGLERGELQLAWDFTTASEENTTGDMIEVRRQVMDYLAAGPPQVEILSVQDDYDENIFRRVEGTVRAPLFLESDAPGARLQRDGDGRVSRNGECAVPFTMLIPRSVAFRGQEDPPARLLQYGHGFFGSRDSESELGHLADTLVQGRFVYLACDWWGMAKPDSVVVIDAIASQPSQIGDFTDRVHQAMANFMVLAAAARGPLAERSEIQVDARPLYDSQHVYFYGNSQGHILGGTYLALSPHVERAALGVGGAAFSLMMTRARPFTPFLDFIRIYLPDALDIQKLLALTQMVLDRIDPLTYAPHLLEDTYPGSPPQRRLLMHMGLNDTQVPNLATELHARVLHLPLLKPSPIEVPGLADAAYPHDGSGLVVFDLGAPPPPVEARPAEDDNGVHSHVRELPQAIQQIDKFLRPGGLIEQTCTGPCDPD